VSKSTLQQRLKKPLAQAQEVSNDLRQLAAGAPAPPKVSRAGRAALPGRGPLPAAPVGLRTLGRLFPSWRPAAETTLRQAGFSVPRAILRDMTRAVHDALRGRNLSELTAAERAALQDLVRTRMLTVSQVVDQELLKRARSRAARVLRRSDPETDLVTVAAPGGLWMYVVPSSRREIVLAEAFAPAQAGTATPPRPSLPGVQTPVWALDDGSVSATPPTGGDVHLSTGLPPAALQQAPEILLEALERAEGRRRGISAGTITGAPVQFIGVPASMRGALGGGVRAVAYRVTESGRRRVTIQGRTRIAAARLRDETSLPDPKKQFGEDSGIERLHLWGSILGDSVTAGIAYGPAALNDAMQRMELILKARGLAKMESVDVTISSIIEMRVVQGTEVPFLLRATYQWTDEGTPFTFSVGIDDVTNEVYLRAGLGEGENLLPRTKSLRRRR
jgi:hypothetical protein